VGPDAQGGVSIDGVGKFAGVGASGGGYLQVRLVLVDLFAALVAWTATLSWVDGRPWLASLGRSALIAAGLSCLLMGILALSKLYVERVRAVRAVEIAGLARASLVCTAAAAVLPRVANVEMSVALAAVGGLTAFLLLTVSRGAYGTWLRSCRARGRYCQPVCIVGVGQEAAAMVELFEGQPEIGFRVTAVIGDRSDWDPGRYPHIPVFPYGEDGEDVVQIVRCSGASGVVMTMGGLPAQELDRLARELVASGLRVQISSGMSRVGHHRMRVSPLSHQVAFYVEAQGLLWLQRATKRAMDLVLTTVGLIFVAPVLALAALAIKLDDRGPILYRQERVGRDGKTFNVIKLRTMGVDASRHLPALLEMNERNGPLFKMKQDPRVTRVGRILRATSIDELPQLTNVLRGEMSLVGPRPALPSEVAQFDPELRERASVLPGMTGLWQVEAGDSPSFHAYRRLDLFYVDNWSVTMDLAILAATVGVVVRRAVELLAQRRRNEAPNSQELAEISRAA
jgi:exopolysaccharide biosynthesis polyprenyl glycosylphosphotransferase